MREKNVRSISYIYLHVEAGGGKSKYSPRVLFRRPPTSFLLYESQARIGSRPAHTLLFLSPSWHGGLARASMQLCFRFYRVGNVLQLLSVIIVATLYSTRSVKHRLPLACSLALLVTACWLLGCVCWLLLLLPVTVITPLLTQPRIQLKDISTVYARKVMRTCICSSQARGC